MHRSDYCKSSYILAIHSEPINLAYIVSEEDRELLHWFSTISYELKTPPALNGLPDWFIETNKWHCGEQRKWNIIRLLIMRYCMSNAVTMSTHSVWFLLISCRAVPWLPTVYGCPVHVVYTIRHAPHSMHTFPHYSQTWQCPVLDDLRCAKIRGNALERFYHDTRSILVHEYIVSL